MNRYIEIVNEVLHRTARILERVGDEVIIVGKKDITMDPLFITGS